MTLASFVFAGAQLLAPGRDITAVLEAITDRVFGLDGNIRVIELRSSHILFSCQINPDSYACCARRRRPVSDPEANKAGFSP